MGKDRSFKGRKGGAVFVTGTGTGVGKTLLSVALCLKLKADYWKPVQTGSPSDSAFAARFLPRERIFKSAFRFQRPLSPNQAARREGKSFQAADILPPSGERFLVTEGIGGVFVPLNDRETVLDLIERLQFPVLIAALSGLGTLNHSLLTLQALRGRKVSVKGLVLSGPSHPDNKRDLERTGKIPVFELNALPPAGKIKKQDFEDALDLKIMRIFS